jgi:hypothetical protein
VARQGLNGNLSYLANGRRYEFLVRVGQLDHGSRMVADEATSRTRRAYYPHRLSAAPFTLTVILKGYNERVLFSNYLNDYVSRALDPSSGGPFPQMTVMVPVRNFLRTGVPLTGIEWGTKVGAIVWQPKVKFETTYDKSIGDATNPGRSQFVLNATATRKAPELKYFYPSGVQLSGDQVPPSGDYTRQVGPQDIADIINGGTPGGSDSGEGWGGIPYAPGQPGVKSPFFR